MRYVIVHKKPNFLYNKKVEYRVDRDEDLHVSDIACGRVIRIKYLDDLGNVVIDYYPIDSISHIEEFGEVRTDSNNKKPKPPSSFRIKEGSDKKIRKKNKKDNEILQLKEKINRLEKLLGQAGGRLGASADFIAWTGAEGSKEEDCYNYELVNEIWQELYGQK